MARLARLVAGVALATLALAGCGAGDSNAFEDFFGGGVTPGGGGVVAESGRINGVILQRTTDNRILILSSAAATNDPSVPVVGAVVTLVEANLSATTGATGTYDFIELQPNTYTLRVTLPAAQGGATADFQITVAPGQTVSGLPAAGVAF